MRFFCLLSVLAAAALAQQTPFIPITAPDGPKGASFLFGDRRGGLWFAGCEAGAEGLTYFDGSRFSHPVKDFPNVLVFGMAEDTQGGLLLATTGGILRALRGQLETIVSGSSIVDLSQIAPDVFLAVLNARAGRTRSADGALVRIRFSASGWQVDTLLSRVPQVQFDLDHSGRSVLFGCPNGYCELDVPAILHWKRGDPLPVLRHAVPTRPSYSTDRAQIHRDRFGCVWMRSPVEASYLCPGDSTLHMLPADIASLGGPVLLELDDGTIVIPSFARIAVGRPGKFRVISATKGYPSTGYAWAGHGRAIWLSNANGTFAFLPDLRLEFWTERDGLDGNTWSILPLAGNVFAIAGDDLRMLEPDRSRWKLVASMEHPASLAAGPDGTILVASRTNGITQLRVDGTVLRQSAPVAIAALARIGDRFWAAGEQPVELRWAKSKVDFKPALSPAPPNSRADFALDDRGSLWFCSPEGLRYRDGEAWPPFPGQAQLLEKGCSFLAPHAGGGLWYAYSAAGAFSLIEDPLSARTAVLHFRGGRRFGIGTQNFFSSDTRGWLWRGTTDGVSVADARQARAGRWLHLGRPDGLPALDTNQHAFRAEPDGSVWFGADDTITHFLPDANLLHPQTAPRVWLASISLDGGAPRSWRPDEAIPSGHDVTAHLGWLQVAMRDALETRYRILPRSSAWQKGAIDFRLGRLRSGQHTLELQARLGDGPWSPLVRESIEVLQPVWLTWPAILGFALAGLAAGGGGVWRQRQASRARKALPELDQWRMAALTPGLQYLAGTLLDGRFLIGPAIAQGGFATVVEAQDTEQAGARCAVKIFRQDLADKAWLARRFRQEVFALEQVRHPNVVCIYGSGTLPDGTQYLVMEFIDGITLRELLERGPLDRKLIAGYVRQIGEALEAIHQHSICHRDLKPENLMIRRSAPPLADLVLIDFSIAIFKDPEETMHGLSRAAGTLHYMAPEQAIGYADPSTDLYSLSKIIIEMLAGQRLSALLPEASLDLPAKVRTLLSDPQYLLGPEAVDLLSAALEFDPARRPRAARPFCQTIAQQIGSRRPRSFSS